MEKIDRDKLYMQALSEADPDIRNAVWYEREKELKIEALLNKMDEIIDYLDSQTKQRELLEAKK